MRCSILIALATLLALTPMAVADEAPYIGPNPAACVLISPCFLYCGYVCDVYVDDAAVGSMYQICAVDGNAPCTGLVSGHQRYWTHEYNAEINVYIYAGTTGTVRTVSVY